MDDEISPANSPATSPTPPKGLIAYKQEQLFHMGPLPAPADFEIYEKTVPGAGDRILKMAEHEQSLRHEIERKRMDATDDDAKERRRLERRGQWFGFFIAILALVIGGYLALHDKTTSAGILLEIGRAHV